MNAPPRSASIEEWLRGEPVPWPTVRSRAPGDAFAGCFYLRELRAPAEPGAGGPTRLELIDRHGVIHAELATGAVLDPRVRTGLYVGVRGTVLDESGRRTLRIDEAAPVDVALQQLAFFLPAGPHDTAAMRTELDAFIDSLAAPELRALVQHLLAGAGEIAEAFRLAPAARQYHHAYLGGLLDHTLSVARLCDRLADHYGPAVDRDLLIAGALLHDIGKIREISARPGFLYTDEGRLLGHIVIGLQIVAAAGAAIGTEQQRLLLVLHLVASHQGRYEWQSPREPRLLEALLLHYADDLDAKFAQAHALLRAAPTDWSDYDRSFGRDFLDHLGLRHAQSPTDRSSPAAGSAADPRLETLDLFESGS